MASRVSDWYFTNGNTVEGIKAQVDDIRAKAAVDGHSVKVGVNAFIIARDTEEEARAVLKEIIDNADPEAVNAFGHEAKQAGKSSPEGEGNWAKSSFEDLVQYNDGFRTNLDRRTPCQNRRAHRWRSRQWGMDPECSPASFITSGRGRILRQKRAAARA